MLGIESIQREMSLPFLASEDLGGEPLLISLREAVELAEDAYLRKDTEALERAERLLYWIHTANSFGQPLLATPQLVWGILMRAKLKTALRETSKGIPAELSAEELRDALLAETVRAERRDHSFIDAIAARGRLEDLVLYSKNWMVTAHGFIEQLASLLPHCSAAQRRIVQENISDEFQGTPHPELRERYLRRIGVDYSPLAALEDPHYLTEAMSILNYRTGVTTLSDPFYALGSFYSVESVFCLISEKLVRALPRFGLNELDYEMFKLHSTVDEGHAEEWLGAIELPGITPVNRAEVLTGARAQMNLRHRLFDAMRARCSLPATVTD